MTHTLYNRLWWLGATVLAGVFGAVLYLLQSSGGQVMLEGRLVRSEQPKFTITSIEADAIAKGANIPAGTLVILKLPNPMKSVSMRTLFSNKSETIRFWGICLEPNPALAKKMREEGRLPGKIFLSRAERTYREEQERQRQQNSIRRLNGNPEEKRSAIRHELEIFEAGWTCYIMTQKPLSIGIDEDEDWLNTFLEGANETDPNKRDTDGDGLFDGLEVLRMRTNPTSTDTDGDGLTDNQEDKDLNGFTGAGETDPRKRDTDGDKLCDGRCLENNGNSIYGEDMNLNGEIDEGEETDPLKQDSDGDGVLDEQEYFNCILGLGTCKYSAFTP